MRSRDGGRYWPFPIRGICTRASFKCDLGFTSVTFKLGIIRLCLLYNQGMLYFLLTRGVTKNLNNLLLRLIMTITYRTQEMKEACHDLRVATRLYGKQIAKKLHRKVALLDAAKDLADLMRFDNNAHWLQGNRNWDFSIPLASGYSLVLRPVHRDTRAPQSHEAMLIITVEDYHR